MLDPVIKTIDVPCSQKQAFEIFCDMSTWWPLDKRSMSLMRADGPAKRLSVDAQLGGRIVETAIDDVEHHWGTFTQFNAHHHLQLDFHMGLPAQQAGQVDVRFTPLNATTTRVELIHSNWEGYDDMAEMMRNGYGSSWGMLFEEAFAAACASE
ncbi:SRPBCC domain-containing protein [Octadecabacter sp. G9-8]|uniref:SRPBCC domain-containing protein n=1 Tax=Octadecabacter dasysiphoniae TaxID=2909341 RepID=A0ABS9CYE2_9RHOB|nr:SRPBCC domain-containing protein [Octadecabacter dasysiphoniae]MCF2872072.1 SRPBCC domain-containing protein [Octadecabacter dasysiphoniae]